MGRLRLVSYTAFLFMLIWHTACGQLQEYTVCNRHHMSTGVKRQAGDGGFAIVISGNPQKYIPGEVYTVSIQGPRTSFSVKKFNEFLLVVESVNPGSAFESRSVGTFQQYGDSKWRFAEDCRNAVKQTSFTEKTEVQVRWNAPPSGSGCLRFKATVVQHRRSWYMDDGDLTKELCEDDQETDDMQPEVLKDCCACDEAKYEVTFEGKWSRQTHPKDFPKDAFLTHFSDLIGASHSNDYYVWKYNGKASMGLKQVAEWGITRDLESELKRQSHNIRTNIKARGLWYPNVNKKTFAVFRVDNRHHLMSVVSMLGPSPDWIVGVSGLELCLKNCSWVQQKKLNLYPWDAGTDDGITYMSSAQPSNHRQNIRRITTSYPNDPRSPFYDPSGRPMNPLATLTVTRQRVYRKTCSDTSRSPVEDIHYPVDAWDETDRPECQTTEWSPWSDCSATCGKGLRDRTRQYQIPIKADMFQCHVPLQETEMCPGIVPTCEGGNGSFKFDDPVCAMTKWSAWTSCSAPCGKGFIQRHRRFKHKYGRKKCHEELIEKESCMADKDCPEEVEQPKDPSCAVTQWSNWSPCSVTCGKGIRMRKRYFLSIGSTKEKCNIETEEKHICHAEMRSCEIDPAEAKKICLLKHDAGPCRGNFLRFYFDPKDGAARCKEFRYGGCRGNRNNFKNYDTCIRTCEFSKDYLFDGKQNTTNYGLIFSKPFDRQDGGYDSVHGKLVVENLLGPRVDCVISDWSEWSSCSVTCGRGWKEQKRTIKIDSQNGGKKCPKKMVRRHKCKLEKCKNRKRHSLESMSSILDPEIYSSPILNPIDPLQFYKEEMSKKETNIDIEPLIEINEDCVMGQWGPWSPCTLSCGPESLQQRARSIIVTAKGSGKPCGPRIERKYCSLPPCTHSSRIW